MKNAVTRFTALLIALVCLLSCGVFVRAEEGESLANLALDSEGVYLVNLETGTVLLEKNARLHLFPASTTKIMTALLVLEHCADIEGTTVTVPNTSLFAAIIEDGGMNMDMRKGEVFTVKDLLLGMMMNSFCDAAELLAWKFGGESTEHFAEMMNEKAAEIGMADTHFVNAHGLHDPDHWSCPRDIALLLETAVKDPRFTELIRTRSGSIPATQYHGARKLTYTVSIFYPENEYYLDVFVGGKSGYTSQAGRCLAAYSEKDGVSYVSVMLGANLNKSRRYGSQNMAWIETNAIVAMAYENYSLKTVVQKGEKVSELPVTDSETVLPVIAGEDLTLLLPNGAEPASALDLPEALSAVDVRDGDLVGRMTVTVESDGEEREFSCPLLLQWDGVPVVTKSALQKEGAKIAETAAGLFKEDGKFVMLLVLLLAVILISVPILKLTQYLRKKRSRPPKH